MVNKILLNINVIKEVLIMSEEYTFSMIKPDITARNLIGQVISYLENGGLKIVAQKMVVLTKTQAELFYIEHQTKPFYEGLVQFITSGPVVLQVLKGENAILKNREIMGATNPADALPGTIRKDLSKSIDENSAHGSDSKNSAQREINFFFADCDIMRR